MTIVVQTTITTVFGELDGEGNVLKKTPVTVEVPKLNKESFLEAFNALKEHKGKLDRSDLPVEQS